MYTSLQTAGLSNQLTSQQIANNQLNMGHTQRMQSYSEQVQSQQVARNRDSMDRRTILLDKWLDNATDEQLANPPAWVLRQLNMDTPKASRDEWSGGFTAGGKKAQAASLIPEGFKVLGSGTLEDGTRVLTVGAQKEPKAAKAPKAPKAAAPAAAPAAPAPAAAAPATADELDDMIAKMRALLAD
jgi:hypothetical protein